MIEYKKGNLLQDNAEAFVNTVNTVGVMGKGIALQFKQAYPENYRIYEKACRAKKFNIGDVLTVPLGMVNPKYIINFPTKQHWREKSKMKYIETGLQALVKEVKSLGIQSIAIPPLGCGNGGLNWEEVRPKIENAFEELPDVHVRLYLPTGSPDPDKLKIGTKKPDLTDSRALLIALLDHYSIPGYTLTLLEIQKLAYFLQETGQPLKLNYKRYYHGPYAENLNFVLQKLEGHYIRGYGDRNRDAQIYLLPDSVKEAREFLANKDEALRRLDRVSEVIRGFETPYGMELLGTVHWVMKEKPSISNNVDEVIKEVQEWSPYKKRTLKENHIRKAWQHLEKQSMIPIPRNVNAPTT
ncbi:type II toxin-antitoxin system antitoxin DNA ADP-ribosyl glycohydrolase DarG [Thermicanus aegyptius]|uniref:type II toxin-antitoxin system antitoxin DNA ADP-ribosyl glycohydrolase DarG n=1 Tax=Thermicanus aegyptius TaxID=94009 RepID=UPI000586ED7F|nr:macro domain-containing protein [Thermicanus aegyptius]